MYRVITIKGFIVWLVAKSGGKGTEISEAVLNYYTVGLTKGANVLLVSLLFYFLSALLIFYLLRKKTIPSCKC